MGSNHSRIFISLNNHDRCISHDYADLVADGATRSSKPTGKKAGTGFGSRKALNDITNKPSIRHEASSKRPTLLKEEFNIAEERFLHDHKRCIEAQLKGKEPCFWDTVLPGHGNSYFSICDIHYNGFSQVEAVVVTWVAVEVKWEERTSEKQKEVAPRMREEKREEKRTDPESPCCYPEPVEMPMLEFYDRFSVSTQWVSPQSSPFRTDSPPSSPLVWGLEHVDFVLKEEEHGC
ncbi:hypothetical protein RHGRI_002054 [Rhododendron griersonianum]|uniref:Uncharacterized protein n=1 Tax=Rhododendron griersonianum TaxID=479676 RepID=A0AAV6LQH4_9ERIC|nr:hypothetical protein RHGRI_002054 [Rhododendron griersonianum]